MPESQQSSIWLGACVCDRGICDHVSAQLEAGGDHYAHRSADRSVDGCLPDENAVLEPESTRNQFTDHGRV